MEESLEIPVSSDDSADSSVEEMPIKPSNMQRDVDENFIEEKFENVIISKPKTDSVVGKASSVGLKGNR